MRPCHALSALLLGTTVLLAAPCASAADARYARTIEHLEREVADTRRSAGIPGLSIALLDEQGIVYARGFGHADRESEVSATPRTRYRVGSITKLITAVAVLQLSGDGLIDLDRPLTDYLPGFSIQSRFPGSPPITVRQLLSHHAGLPSDLHKGMWTDARFTRVLTRLSEEHAVYPPGLVHAYSNPGYSLLGHLVEAVTGRSYEQYVAERILGPLGMQDADFSLHELAAGHAADRPGEPLPLRDLPALGLSASAMDLARFLTLFLGQQASAVLSPELVFESMRPQNTAVALDLDDRVGIGWTLDRCRLRNVGRVAEHGGTTLLFSGQVMVVPRYGLGVVVLANRADARAAVKHLAEEALIAAVAEHFEVDAEQHPAGAVSTALADDPPAPIGRASYITRGGLLTLDTRRDELCACTPRSRLPLIPEPGGWYRVQRPRVENSDGPRLTRRQMNGHDIVVLEAHGREQRLGTRVEIGEIPAAWRERTGDYRIVNPDTGFPVVDVCLFEENGLLHLGYRMPRLARASVALPLAALSDDEAIVLGLGRGRGDTLRARTIDGREHILFSGYLARRVHDPLAVD